MTNEQLYLLKLASVSETPSFDASAQAYMDALVAAGASLNSTQQNAINALVVALKAAGVWNSMTAVYPLVGGTAASHAVNALSPGTYNITWSGAITHDANGALGDGSSGYGDTGIAPAGVAELNASNVSMGFYCNLGNLDASGKVDMGSHDSDTQTLMLCGGYNSGFSAREMACYSDGGWGANATDANDTQGFLVGTQINPSQGYLHKNGTQILSNTSTQNTVAPSSTIYLLARNHIGSAQYFTPRRMALAFVGAAVSASSQSALYSAVQAFEASLGRNV